MNNQLKNETSPYLLQHAENPVNWYPWGEEAFAAAKAADKPVFLSIGYSTCHWCHVMAHESFEDVRTAEILNQFFISIKVDREERPDIDSVYMAVCQAFTGSGGWPMSIFMTWDKRPFFAGTYFPPRPAYGMPGFTDLLTAIAAQWKNKRSELLQSADALISHFKNAETAPVYDRGMDLPDEAVKQFQNTYDSACGGFGPAPKFPTPHNLLFLLLYSKLHHDTDVLEMVQKTLIQMRKGGIFDQIGSGFSRYSTDRFFLAPHFEKMLYDNALLTIACCAAYKVSGQAVFLDTAEKTAAYVLREMRSPDGAYYSAQDADSEGVEGRFYTFTKNEIINVLGEEKGRRFAQAFDITAEGNFEGVNIPNLLKSNDLSGDYSVELQKLYDYRMQRTKLHLDDKILLSWNAMMIAALSILYGISQKEEYLAAAQKAEAFIEKNLCSGLTLFTGWRSGRHTRHCVLDDYAFYIAALLELYHATLDNAYSDKAERFCAEALRQFWDRKNGGFYLSPSENSELFFNPKETYDGAVPSGNSMMAYNLVRLYQLTENEKYRELAEKQLAFISAQAQDYPMGHSMFLLAKLVSDNPPEHITVVLKDFSQRTAIRSRLPFFSSICVVSPNNAYPLINDQTTYYVCKNHCCLPPVNEYDDLKRI